MSIEIENVSIEVPGISGMWDVELRVDADGNDHSISISPDGILVYDHGSDELVGKASIDEFHAFLIQNMVRMEAEGQKSEERRS